MISWYSKGAIFTKPTVLGNIGVGDANNGIGNAPEAVLPINHLRKYVREEVQGVLNNLNLNQGNNITISELLHIDNFNNDNNDDVELIIDKIIMTLKREFAF